MELRGRLGAIGDLGASQTGMLSRVFCEKTSERFEKNELKFSGRAKELVRISKQKGKEL